MNKPTFKMYVNQGIFTELSEPKWGENRSAIFKVKARSSNKQFFNAEVKVLGYYPQPIY